MIERSQVDVNQTWDLTLLFETEEAFNEALDIFEKEFNYHASFDKISQALEVAEPGVTNRFVTSYEKTREAIRF